MKVSAAIRLAALALAGAALAASAGCGTRTLAANASGTGGTSVIAFDARPGTDGTFQPTRDVDILFMIDNTAGRLVQDNLLRNFPAFITTLSGLVGGLPNLHIAVVTSDLGAGDGSIASCSADGGDAGIFKYTPRGTCTTSGLDPGATFISDVDGVKNYTGYNIEDVFTCIASVGESGCGFEQPLAAVARALGADGRPMPAENQGFLRQDALLFIVLLTDEDDCSVPPGSALFDTTSNVNLAAPLGPVTGFRCNEFGHLCNGAKPPRRAPTGSANDRVTLDGCVSAEGAGMLTPLATLRAQIRSLKPFPDQQILVSAIAGTSAPYTVEWRNPSVADTGPWPVIDHSCMASDGSFASPAVRINEFAAGFGANGQAFSVCVDSFAPILSTLALRLAEHLPIRQQ